MDKMVNVSLLYDINIFSWIERRATLSQNSTPSATMDVSMTSKTAN